MLFQGLVELFFRRKTRSFRLPARSLLANFGCGKTFHPAWDNFDFVSREREVRQIDLLSPLPFADETYEMVYCSHVLEHLPRGQVEVVLAEFRRILRTGGILRIVVPDLEAMVREYLCQLDATAHGDEKARTRHAWMSLELIDQFVRRQSGGFMARWWRSRPVPEKAYVAARVGDEARAWMEEASRPGFPALSPAEIYLTPELNSRRERRFRKSGEQHQWAYDRISLEYLLAGCGFVDVQICRAGQSYLEAFSSYALDTTSDGRIRKPDSLFMEARKRSG